MAMYLYMPDIQDKYLKATQFYDLVDSKTMKAVVGFSTASPVLTFMYQ